MSKKLTPAELRYRRVEEICGIAPDKFATAVLFGAIKIEVDPEFLEWVKSRKAQRKKERYAMTKTKANQIVRHKIGDDYACAHPIDKPYVFVVIHKDTGAIIGRGPSWEAAIKAAEEAKEGEK